VYRSLLHSPGACVPANLGGIARPGCNGQRPDRRQNQDVQGLTGAELSAPVAKAKAGVSPGNTPEHFRDMLCAEFAKPPPGAFLLIYFCLASPVSPGGCTISCLSRVKRKKDRILHPDAAYGTLAGKQKIKIFGAKEKNETVH